MSKTFDKSTFGWTFFISLITVATVTVILNHNRFIKICHGIGFSHTVAYFVPYILLLLCGWFLSSMTRRISRKSFRWVSAVLLFILPILVGFSVNPIYEDAIYVGGRDVRYNSDALSEDYKISIVVIPDCPFCKRAIQQSGQILDKPNELAVEVVLCSSDSAATANYTRMLPDGVILKNAQAPDSLAKLIGGSFPAYCARISGDQMRVWSNNEFGPRAMDFIANQ